MTPSVLQVLAIAGGLIAFLLNLFAFVAAAWKGGRIAQRIDDAMAKSATTNEAIACDVRVLTVTQTEHIQVLARIVEQLRGMERRMDLLEAPPASGHSHQRADDSKRG